MKILKMIGIGLLVLLLLAVLFITYRFISEGEKSRAMQPSLGVVEGRLTSCPKSPNCVSSYETDEVHSIDVIEGDANTLAVLKNHIASLPNTSILEQSSDYLYATYESKLFGFVDDLELYFDGSVVQVRSASRVGYSDLDANRKRVEALRSLVDQ